MQTHEVFNQVPPLAGYDTADEAVLLDALDREGAGWAADEVHELGLLAGGEEAQEHGRLRQREPAGCCAPTTATGTGSTRSSSTRPGTS